MEKKSQRGGSRFLTSNYKALVATALLLGSDIPLAAAKVYPSNHESYKFNYLNNSMRYLKPRRTLSKRDNPIPLIITNNCREDLWPGIATQHGDPPESGGFALSPGKTRNLTVGPDWQGRIWGRTNCTTSGDTATCMTGDCFGKLACEFGGAVPVTLAEFNLAGGETGKQTFYDISLVDGYNLPLGIVYHPAPNTTKFPPNLLNAACIATPGYLTEPARTGTFYTNSSFPTPYEDIQTNAGVSKWCPWDLQAFLPEKPGDGVYPYPDDNVQRPSFDPCKSACAATNKPSDCCTGKYDDPSVCKPGLYSGHAKAMCPDAYSFAFDDHTSTFIIPSGGGWEVVFCPEGRSTNILATFGEQLQKIASGQLSAEEIRATTMNETFIESQPDTTTSSAASSAFENSSIFACVIAVTAAFLML
ncbi:thaumatin family protein [Apiospora arundinis]|uniref:Thaumatin family protein n=1 Tax=Apiospora arundinis TaxID=335852 RepID=A0ABR2HRK5_9PEZI